MTATAMRDAWYPVGLLSGLNRGGKESRLLGEEITVYGGDAAPKVVSGGRDLPVVERFGHLWTSLGSPDKDLFTIPEADHPDRTLVDVGVVRVKCSPLRAVENFLDVAHFPFVHTDILGAESHPEVAEYKVEIRDDVDEVWATKVEFYQPQAAKSPGEWDVIALFVQPLTEDLCDVWPWMALFDDETSLTDLIHFQQLIFLQDRPMDAG